MTFRLFLFFIATFSVYSETEAQLLVKYAHYHGFETNGNVKELKSTSYTEDQEYKFDINLLRYRQNSSSTLTYLFNREHQITSVSRDHYISDDSTGAINKTQRTNDYHYNNGFLVEVSSHPFIDSLNHPTEYKYLFDNKDRVIQIKKIYKDSVYQLENVEYLADEKKSTIYYFDAFERKDTLETHFDLQGNIIKKKYTTDYHPQFCFYHEYYYDADGKLNNAIYKRYESLEYHFINKGKEYCG